MITNLVLSHIVHSRFNILGFSHNPENPQLCNNIMSLDHTKIKYLTKKLEPKNEPN
jgi:hypothetical protein